MPSKSFLDAADVLPTFNIPMKMIPAAILGVFVLFFATQLHAEVPMQLQYDGYLLDSKSQPVTGNRTMSVRLYDAPTAGNVLYSETIGVVRVLQGDFGFKYGNAGSGIASALTAKLHYLGVVVDGVEQRPRVQLVSVPFALRSGDGQKILQDMAVVTQALGRTINAFGGNYSTMGGNLTAAVAGLEKTAQNLVGIKNDYPVLVAMKNEFRVISLSGNLTFGSVALNGNATQTLTITNKGFGKLNVSGITYPSGFTGAWSGQIAPGGSQNVVVKFSPTQLKTYNGTITISSDATSGNNTIILNGTGSASSPTPSLVMVTVQGGTLPSGSELAGQKVATFQIGKYEVTWGEWKTVRDWALGHGYSDLAGVGGTYPDGAGDNFPVLHVSWYDVVKWCNAKSEKEGKTAVYLVSGAVYRSGEYGWDVSGVVTQKVGANGYRLPSEAEWEWAAMGGVSSQGYTYSGSNDANAVAWTWENSSDGTKAVGTKSGNELGIYDMSGNVWEWCWDVSDPDPSYRRIRGGSWYYNASGAPVSYRDDYSSPDYRSYDYGFRPACSSGN